MPDLIPGQSVAQRFKLTSRLEAEASCERWLADDDVRKASAVLRIFPDTPLSAVSAETRLELQRLSRLVHPNIIPCLGLFDCDGAALIAYADVPGGDLRDWSGREYREVLSAMMPVMAAVAYLHDLGVVHGQVDERRLRNSEEGTLFLDATGAAELSQANTARPTAADDLRAMGGLLVRLTGAEDGIPLPDTLSSLFRAMRSGNEQVPDMHSARRQIARVLQLADEPAPTVAEGAGAGPVVGRSRAARLEPVSKRPAEPRPSVPMMVALPALIAILAVAAGVFYFLPDPAPSVAVEARATSSSPTAASSATAAATESTEAPFAAAATAKARQDAQDAAMALLRSLIALEERGAEAWAADDLAAARLAGEEGDATYRKQAFKEALARYREGLAMAEALVARSGAVLNDALAAGNAALQDGNAEEARRQFEMASAVDKENPEAKSGLARAEALTTVLQLMAEGERAEQAGQFADALENYRQAVNIDARFQAAKDAVSRMEAGLGNQRYQQAMSRGFAELNNGNISAARSAFEQAARMRPSAAGPRDALAQLGLSLRNNEIGDRRSAAAEAEQAEQWQRAVAEYQAALEVDNTLVFARDGLERARQRAQLDERMSLLINEPLRMFSNEVYNEARAMLVQARSIDSAGPRLREQIAALDKQVAQARTPVTVQMQSDGQTTVVIYKVGQLGSFDQRSVGLIPGRYTAVGTRAGYRDVRREFVIQAGSTPPPVTVICEERV